MSRRRSEPPWYLMRGLALHMCFPLNFRRREWWYDDVRDAAFGLGAHLDTRNSGQTKGVFSKAMWDDVRVQLYREDGSRWTDLAAEEALALIGPLLAGPTSERERSLLGALDGVVPRFDRPRARGRKEIPSAIADMRFNPPTAWMPPFRLLQGYLRDQEPDLLTEV